MLKEPMKMCYECGEWKTVLECWKDRNMCRVCGSKYNAARWRAQAPVLLKMKKKDNAVRMTLKYLDKLNVDGECLVCDCNGFHADGCEAGILIKKLRSIQ